MIPHQSHPHDGPFLSANIKQFPFRFRPHVAKRYSSDYASLTRQQANINMLEMTERLKFDHVNLSLISDDNQIIEKAKTIADKCSKIYKGKIVKVLKPGNKPEKYPQSPILKIKGFVTVSIGGSGFEGVVTEALKHITIDYLPELEYKSKKEYQDSTAARLSDELWWRRVLRKQQGRAIEKLGRNINLVNKRSGLYCSDETLSRRQSQKARNRALLEMVKAYNQEGQEYTLQELFDLSVSNPKIRRDELMVRIRGFTEYAQIKGHVGEFWTITLPSKYHASLSKNGQMNPKFDPELTPRKGQEKLAKDWARVRAAFQRKGINVYGFRVAEPQQDGTPHWHMLLFMAPEHRYKARQIYFEMAIKEDKNELWGRTHVRFDAKSMNAGGAAGYIAKYISKNIDGYKVGNDFHGKPAVESAMRVDAWASTWGIRQFQQIGGHSVSVYRDLRGLTEDDIDRSMYPHWSTADASDWCGYLLAMDENPIERITEIAEEKENRYGEKTGLIIFGLELNEIMVLTQFYKWTTERIGSIDSPWSPVNNCTEVKKENVRSETKNTIGSA